jgi:hypothetical protein
MVALKNNREKLEVPVLYSPKEKLLIRIIKLPEHLHTEGIQGALIVQNAFFLFFGTCQDCKNAHLLLF